MTNETCGAPATNCETCGAPATNWARDIIEQFPSPMPYRNFKGGDFHFGCDAHPANSERVRYEGIMSALANEKDHSGLL